MMILPIQMTYFVIPQTAKLHQHLFEFAFQVETLQASLFKTDPAGVDKLLAKASLERFALEFALAKFDMKVDIALRCGDILFFTYYTESV